MKVIKPMKEDDMWDLFILSRDAKPIGFKWIRKDERLKGIIKLCIISIEFSHREGI